MTIPDDVKMTPWLDQYRDFKAQYPDALLLFRMGDFDVDDILMNAAGFYAGYF